MLMNQEFTLNIYGKNMAFWTIIGPHIFQITLTFFIQVQNLSRNCQIFLFDLHQNYYSLTITHNIFAFGLISPLAIAPGPIKTLLPIIVPTSITEFIPV